MSKERPLKMIFDVNAEEKKSISDAAHDARLPMGEYLRKLHEKYGKDFVASQSEK